MECRTASEDVEAVYSTNTVITEVPVDTTYTVDTEFTQLVEIETDTDTRQCIDTSDTTVTVDSMGSGDATSLPVCASEFSQDDVQDMILPQPLFRGFLPSLVDIGEMPDSVIPVTLAVQRATNNECNGQPENWDIQDRDDWNISLSPKDIYDIQKFFSGIPREDESEMKVDLTKMEVLFRCEACQEMPISSESVHTCDFGHQACGICFNNGVRMCVVCKGHLTGNNVPLENVLRRLRQSYPYIFRQATPPIGIENDINYMSRYYSLKPIACPQHGCPYRTSARGLLVHFIYEHRQIPKIEVTLFEPCTVLVPKKSLDNTNGMVVAGVNVGITEKNIASRLATDFMTCWVMCGAIHIGQDKALALWVSCVYEEAIMPPILFSLRAPTHQGYSSFGGQMTTLHDYKDPQSVLASGRCLLLFPKDISNVLAANNGSLALELKFYLF